LFVELASLLGLVDLVAAGDALVRKHLVSPEDLRQYCDAQDAPYVARARRAASFVRAGVDSPRESAVRMLMVLAGLPEPEINIAIRDDEGNILRRYDTGFREQRLLIEYDGRQHAEDTRQWQRDLQRREELDRAGWRILIVTSTDLDRQPGATLARISEAMRGCGVPKTPARLRREWRRHFPTDERRP